MGRFALAMLLLASLAASCSAAVANPASVKLKDLDTVIQDAIRSGQMPGAVVIIGHNGQVVYRKAFGSRALEPRRESMTLDTVFDMASLTKVVVTTTAIMQLVERGKVRLNDPVVRYLPEFGQNGKQEITVRELLTHYSGLREDLDLKESWQGKDTAYRLAFAETPVFTPGSRFMYSDINFIILGAVVEKVTGESLDVYAGKNIFEPLKMIHTRFLQPATIRPKIAPTEYDEQGRMLRGTVHDPTARRMGGVAGHAGVFSTADDMTRFAASLLGESKILSKLSIEKMTTPQQPPTAHVLRGLGWDIDSPFSTNRGEFLPVGSFGHTGFTGTSLWIDPTTKTYVIVLANAVHPRGGRGAAVPLRAKVATTVATALSLTSDEKEKLRWESITGYNETQTAARRVSSRNATVKTGVDVLEASNFALLQEPEKKKKIGLLTNQTGVDAQGQRTIDVLAHAPGVSLEAIFTPEHGVTGTLDTTNIGNSRDAATGAPVYNVYGASDAARRPRLDVLKDLDAVVVDIQDAGVRFYTYESTLGYFLEATAKVGIELIVLDRPNPITGAYVQGPVSDGQKESFVNYHTVPIRHGMTMGELAKLFNAERGINGKLQVVAMEGWLRGDWYDSTALPWVNPSPNLRSLSQGTLYPGVGLVEGTNVSVGRGTQTPFEVLGAPWIKGAELAAYLNQRMISGVRFVPVTFTPDASNYAGQQCEGVNLIVVDRNAFDAPELGIEIASALHKLYPDHWDMHRLNELLVNQRALDAISRDEDPRRIALEWQEDLQKFIQLREKYLLYK